MELVLVQFVQQARLENTDIIWHTYEFPLVVICWNCMLRISTFDTVHNPLHCTSMSFGSHSTTDVEIDSDDNKSPKDVIASSLLDQIKTKAKTWL